MIKKFIKGRTAVLIDASNIYFSQKTLGWQVDFRKLLTYLKHEADVKHAFFYTAYDPEAAAQRKFLDFLNICGYKVRRKEVKFIKSKEGNINKGNLDVELTIDAIHFKDDYDTLLLFSGDSDFAPLVKYLRRFGKHCLSFSTKGHISKELIEQSKFIDIKKIKEYVAK